MSYSSHKGYITKPKPGVRLNPFHPLSKGLVGCWLFNEGAGGTVRDISGNNNHGTLNNMDPAADWVGTIHGSGLAFDGSDDNITIANSAILNPPGDMTLSLWIRFNSLPSVTGNIATIIYKAHGSSPYQSYKISFSTTNKPSFYWVNTASTQFEAEYLGDALLVNTWYHIIGILSGTSMDLYINGSNANIDKPTISGTIYNSTDSLFFADDDGSDKLNGVIDDVRIYNRALLPIEIKQLYTDPYANFLTPQIRRPFVEAVVSGDIGNRLLRGHGI